MYSMLFFDIRYCLYTKLICKVSRMELVIPTPRSIGKNSTSQRKGTEHRRVFIMDGMPRAMKK